MWLKVAKKRSRVEIGRFRFKELSPDLLNRLHDGGIVLIDVVVGVGNVVVVVVVVVVIVAVVAMFFFFF